MNNVYIKHYADEDSLTHYGVKGMKWRHRKGLTNPLDTLEQMRAEREESRKQEALKLGGDKAFVEKSKGYRDAVIREHKQKKRKEAVSRVLHKTIEKKAVSRGASFFSKLRSHGPITHERTFSGYRPKKRSGFVTHERTIKSKLKSERIKR